MFVHFVLGIAVFLVSGQIPVAAQIERQSIAGGGVLFGKLENPDAASDEDYLITFNETGAVILEHDLLRKKEVIRPELL